MTTESQEILASILARLPEVLEHLLVPGGKVVGKQFVCGGVTGGPGKSCHIELEGEKAGVYHDWSTDESGSISKLWMINQELPDYQSVIKAMAKWLGLPPMEKPKTKSKPLDPKKITFTEPRATASNQADPMPAPPPEAADPMPEPSKPQEIDWDTCLVDFDENHAEALCKARGYSPRFTDWLHEMEMVGIYKGCVAFPVHDASGKVARIHFQGRDHWEYFPKGGETAPLVIGAPREHAAEVLLFESQWDAFAMLDRLEIHHPENANKYCAYITRGANCNTDISRLRVSKVTACPQNDPPDKASKTTGRTPAEEWTFKLKASKAKDTAFRIFETPLPHKDANDWLRSPNAPGYAQLTAAVERARNPILKGLSTTDEILGVNIADDPNSLIGYKKRFLGLGSSLLVVGPSGIGKSTLSASIIFHAAAGKKWNGITFRRPLKVLVVQAENDQGDLSEMISGALSASGFDRETQAVARKNVVWVQESSRTGLEFCKWLEEILVEVGADLVIIDPLLSYVGDDISQQKVASAFLRNGLQPILNRTGVIMIVIHHTGKPAKDPNAHKNWSDSDYSYIGLGSSDVTNWARAIAVFSPWGINSGVYRFLITKRGTRAGMIDAFTGESATSIFLQHAGHGLGWVQCGQPEESETAPRSGGRKQSVTAADVMKELGDGSTASRKDVLLSGLSLKHGANRRTASDRLDALIDCDRVHVSGTEPRPGGGKPIVWIRTGPAPNGNNQTETSK